MSSCTLPGTLRPGFAFFRYGEVAGTLAHVASLGINHVVDISDIAAMRTEMNAVTDLVQRVIPAALSITSWGIMLPDRSVYYEEAYGTAKVGSHGAATNAVNWKSATVTLTGKGQPPAPGGCVGQTRLELFTYNAYFFQPGQQFIASTGALPLDDLAVYLALNSVVWADNFGQEAIVRGRYPVQFNAAVQRKHGT